MRLGEWASRRGFGTAVSVLVVAAGLVVLAGGGDGQVRASSSPAVGTTSTIQVTGQASVSLLEDQATFTATVQEDGSTAALALSSDNSGMSSVLAALHAAGATQSDISTSGLSVYPRYSGQKLTGFSASNTVTVQVPQLSNLGAWLDAAVNAGATGVGSVSLTASGASSVTDQALSQAMADARQKAETLAKAGNLTLGAVQSISEQSSLPGPRPLFAAAAPSALVTPIEAGNEEVTATVQVTFAATPNAS